MFSGKKFSIGLLLMMVLAIVVLSMYVLIGDDDKTPAPVSSIASEVSSEVISKSSVVYETADTRYDQSLYNEGIKSYEATVLSYNADLDKNYLPDTLFIGDSNTLGLFSFGYMPLQNVIGKMSMAIQSVRSSEFVCFSGYDLPMTISKAVELLKPRRIIINFGTNNTSGTSVEDFSAIYKKSLKEIEAAYPYADIIVAAVLPVGKSRENMRIKMQMVDSFNIALAQVCSESGYRFLNTAETFKDPDSGFMKSDYVARDGIHLNSAGYNALLEYITDHKLMTQDRRPPRGFVPKRLEQAPPPNSETPPEYVQEPGEEVVFPPTVEDSSTAPPPASSGNLPQSSSDTPVGESTPDTNIAPRKGSNDIVDPFL